MTPSSENSKRGKLLVISGPSGVGKGTLVARLAEAGLAWVSISATTRAPREGEQEGREYYFMSKEDFLQKTKQNGFIEWAEYSGNYYGTPADIVEQHLANGENVILEIEVQGALQVRDATPEACLIFIEPPSLEVLEQRLRGRGTESESAIFQRLNTARLELEQKMKYDYVLVNDNLDCAFEQLRNYIQEL